MRPTKPSWPTTPSPERGATSRWPPSTPTWWSSRTEHDAIFGNVASLVSALLKIGGQPELAARVRPSARRPGQTVELAEGDDIPQEPGPAAT